MGIFVDRESFPKFVNGELARLQRSLEKYPERSAQVAVIAILVNPTNAETDRAVGHCLLRITRRYDLVTNVAPGVFLLLLPEMGTLASDIFRARLIEAFRHEASLRPLLDRRLRLAARCAGEWVAPGDLLRSVLQRAQREQPIDGADVAGSVVAPVRGTVATRR